MILKKNTIATNCPNQYCKGKHFKIIEKTRTAKRKKEFTKNNIEHVHNNGIQYERVKCLDCGCTFIQTYKQECWNCNYNKRFKSIIIIIKNGRNTNDL